MTSPYETAHFLRTQAQNDEQNESLAALVEVMRVQAEASRNSQRAAWWFSGVTLVIAAGSLTVAILALVLR